MNRFPQYSAGEHTLARVLLERGRLNEARCRVIGAQVFATLKQLHQVGLFSGSIDAANLVVMPDGRVLLAKAAASIAEAANAGSPKTNSRDVMPEADIVSLAALLTLCATGVEIDPKISWSHEALVSLGCSDALATDLANCFADPTNSEVCRSLFTHGAFDPKSDLAPTIDFEPTTIEGLEPLPLVDTTQPTTPVAWQGRFWHKFARYVKSNIQTG